MSEVLIHCRAQGQATPGVAIGLALAQRLGVRADGLYVAALYPGAFASPETVAMTLAAVKREYEQALGAAPWWSEQLAARGLAGTWHVAEGETVECLCQAARWSDLIVIERSAQLTHAPIGYGVVSRTVFASGLPVLVVPDSCAATTCGSRVAVAWNGSREAARALRGALPVLAKADSVIVLEGERACAPGDAPRQLVSVPWTEFLARAGVRYESRAFAPRAGETGASLLEAAQAAGADLIVMGAWGHSRITELILGGTTRHLLSHSAVPLLVAH